MLHWLRPKSLSCGQRLIQIQKDSNFIVVHSRAYLGADPFRAAHFIAGVLAESRK
jgi:hypothetical protein